MYPRARLDALTDGVFTVAMTLLVLDVRLPEDFHPHDATELMGAVRGLVAKFVPYLLSFLVLASLVLVIVSSLLAVAFSFVSPRQALWAFALNIAAPWLARHGRSSRRSVG